MPWGVARAGYSEQVYRQAVSCPRADGVPGALSCPAPPTGLNGSCALWTVASAVYRPSSAICTRLQTADSQYILDGRPRISLYAICRRCMRNRSGVGHGEWQSRSHHPRSCWVMVHTDAAMNDTEGGCTCLLPSARHPQAWRGDEVYRALLSTSMNKQKSACSSMWTPI
jgi:hypothetical protein